MPKVYTILLAAIVAVASLVLLSVAYRLSRGKPILTPEFRNVHFLESWRSGRASHTYFSVIAAGLRNCLWIAVTQDELIVGPHFPFSLLFIPEILHLDYRVPGKRITATEEVPASAGGVVRVHFLHATGQPDSFEIDIGNVEDFKRALAAIRD
ncbi:MAG: hypothetical protein L0387_12425 [Acidobacteria bacterium]|nr:hypothetical protein [Acidobacteriota bacterium]MCI0622446.1 hypothetical protein [Acidobacteriota bacterium]MCI0722364.1 hypothetical protein [Acidobacteriota bacterium]